MLASAFALGAGRQLYRFRNALLQDMKATFKNTSARALLAEGFIVAHVVNMGAGASQGHLIADAGAGGQALDDLWLHIGLHYVLQTLQANLPQDDAGGEP